MAEQKKSSRPVSPHPGGQAAGGRGLRILGGVALVFAIAAVWFLVRPSLSRTQPRHIILISIDTCRADHLSCYGCPRITTPSIDAVADEAFLFQNAVSPVPLTLPAHISMLTGTIPPFHGVHDNEDYKMSESAESLAEILHRNGYATGAIISSFVMDSQFGLAQGFDTYNDKFDEELNTVGIVERRGEEVSRYALKWLEQHQHEPFFLFLHYYDPHAEYVPPEPFASIFKPNFYIGEIAYSDYCVGQVIDQLKKLGLYDSSLIIITSDHGEMRNERGERTHGYFIYQSALKVPLLFKLPDQSRPRKINEIVGLIDIVPTVCALVGLEVPVQMQGEDLSPYFRKNLLPGRDRRLYCESLYPTKYDANPLLGIVTKRFKYIHTTRPELYDLSKDPKEENNLINQQSGQARSLQNSLKQILQKYLRRGDSESRLLMDGQARRRLESLGYVAGRVKEEFEVDQSKEDPKDLIGFHSSDVKARDFIFVKKYAEARSLCEQMLQQRPESYRVHFILASIALEQQDFAEAVVWLSKALRIQPTSGDAHYNMGIALQSLGKSEEAIQHYYQALRFKGDDALVRNNLAAVFQLQGRLDEAIQQYQQALNVDDDNALIHYNFAIALQSQGRLDEAINHYRRAIQLKADYDEAHHNLGNALSLQGNFKEAAVHWAESLRLKPGQVGLLRKLGRVSYEERNIDDALAYFSEAVRIEPNQYQLYLDLGNLLYDKGDIDPAITNWNKAIQLTADQPEVRRNLRYLVARQLAQYGKLDEAIEQWKELLKSEPNDPALYNNLAIAFYKQGRFAEAIDHWKKLLEIRPDDYQILHNLGWLFATHPNTEIRNPTEAIRLARRACELTGYEKSLQLDALAAAYASAGRFDEAVETAEKALQQALSSGEEKEVELLGRRLELYKAGQPYVETSLIPSGDGEK